MALKTKPFFNLSESFSRAFSVTNHNFKKFIKNYKLNERKGGI